MIEAVLRMSEESTPQEAEQAWGRLRIYDPEVGYQATLYLAAEGVRPLYRQLLWQIQMENELRRFAEQWSKTFLQAEGVSPEQSRLRQEDFARVIEKLLESLHQAGARPPSKAALGTRPDLPGPDKRAEDATA